MPGDSATAYGRNGIASEAPRKEGGSQWPRATLRREIHAAQEVLEARVGAQGVERRVDLQETHPLVVHFVSPFQPLEGSILFTQPRVDEREFPSPPLLF